jgi:ATP-dependent metalloprotease
MVPEKDLLT